MQGLTQMYEPNYDLLLKETEKNQRRTAEKTTFHLVQQPFKISTNLVVMLIIFQLLEILSILNNLKQLRFQF